MLSLITPDGNLKTLSFVALSLDLALMIQHNGIPMMSHINNI